MNHSSTSRKLLRILLSLMLAASAQFLCANAARATDYVFTSGAANAMPPGDPTAYTDPRNWAPMGVPGAGDSATINGPRTVNAYGTNVNLANLTLLPSVYGAPSLLGTGDLTVTGVFNFTNGTTAFSTIHLPMGAQMNVNTYQVYIGGTFENNGTVIVDTGIYLLNGAVFNNHTLVNYRQDGPFGNGPGVFNNLVGAVFRKSGGNGEIAFSLPINDSGTFDIQSGWVRFYNNYPIALSTPTFSGAGAAYLRDDDTTLSGTLTINGLAFDIEGNGVLGGTGAITTTNGGVLKVTNGQIAANRNDVMTLTAGSSMLIDAGMLLEGTLVNNATITWTGGAINFSTNTPSTINNNGLFDARTDSFLYGNNAGIVNNASGATFRKGAGTNTTYAEVVFNNSGTIESDTGKLEFLTGTLNLSNGSGMTGPGVIALVNQMTTLSGALTVNGSVLGLSSTLGGTGTVTTTNGGSVNAGDCQIGNVQGDTITLSSGSSMTVSGVTGIQGTLNNNGGIRILSNGVLAFSSAFPSTMNNAGVVDLTTDTVALGNDATASTFNNLAGGTMLKSGGSGTSFVRVPVHNQGSVAAQSGTLEIVEPYTQTDGATLLSGGILRIDNMPLRIQGGSLSGSGTVQGDVISGGAVNPGGAGSPGIIHVTGAYTQTASGSLNIDIGLTSPGSGYDQLNVDGAATLGGTLNVATLSNFTFHQGDVFQVMTYASHTGAFSTQNAAGFAVNVRDKDVILTANSTRYVHYDFNADKNADLLWQNQATGGVYYWLMNGTQFSGNGGYIIQSIDTNWHVAAVADLNGDGQPDLIWQNSATGDVYYWLMNGTQYSGNGGYIIQGMSPDWKLVSAADLNNDGSPDLIWQNQTTGGVYYWLMNGVTYTGKGGYIIPFVDTDWKVVAAADLNGDGYPDLLWQNRSTGGVYYWLMSGTQFSGVGDFIISSIDTAWHIVGTPDLNADGYPDLLWQNSTSGAVYFWLMNGVQFSGNGGYIINSIDLNWKIVGIH